MCHSGQETDGLAVALRRRDDASHRDYGASFREDDAPGPSDQYNIEAPPVVVSTGATYDNTNTADDWVDGDIVETSTTLDEQEALSSPTTSSSSAENSEMWRVLEREHEEAFRASLRQLAACNALSELRRATLAEYSSSEGELASPY
ncbi:hypothetical protein EVJ58_g1388 [Rhodofomes roseus]|uniref:Uncharacterized protein n=1 Tax=Rhodofomes roseus TaxID=34475 RepID=A0A4Y9Z359_9APHY|nr:hypothetical protein EVJ58_g1388 [Rhodofomes roseus]